MLMGSFLLFCGCVLYALLKPTVPESATVYEEIVVPKHAMIP